MGKHTLSLKKMLKPRFLSFKNRGGFRQISWWISQWVNRGASQRVCQKGHRGQILLEGLLFIIFVLSFLTAVQYFQFVARKEIQQKRLSKKNSLTIKKAPWVKIGVKQGVKTGVKPDLFKEEL